MKLFKSISLVIFASLVMMACGKSGNKNMTSGSLTSDGQKVTSQNSNIGGVGVNITIANISNTASQNNLTYSGGAGLSFDLSINGSSQKIWAPLMMSDNDGFAAFSGFGSFMISSNSVCKDNNCSEMILDTLIMSSNGYNLQSYCKEILIKKNIQQNKIVAIKELNINCNQSLDTVSKIRAAL